MFRPTRRQLRQANWEASNPAYVFVYGTLKSGGASHEHITASEGIYYGEAEIQGIQLYLTPAMFPAAIDDPNGFARGEIWHVKHLHYMDRLEGNGDLYWRERRTFTLDDGSTIEAWIYLFLREITEFMMPLVSGVYDQDPFGWTNENCFAEYVTAKGYRMKTGEDGFEHYDLDDATCIGDCDQCPYLQFGVDCLYQLED